MAKEPKYPGVGWRMRVLRRIAGNPRVVDMADRLGLTETQLHNYLAGASRPTVDAAERICDHFRITMDWLFRGADGGLSMDTARRIEGAEDDLRNGPRLPAG